MAILETKKNKTEVEAKDVKKDSAFNIHSGSFNNVILRPRVTEKSSERAEKNVYVFEVSPRATKNEVSKAMQSIYKVKPVMVNIAKIPSKKVFVRGKWGVKSGGKKAFVYLKESDKIEII